jgi:cytochrome bd-type quinol oxidase subunit 1
MATLISLLLLPFAAILRGFVLVKMWSWFVVPQFHCAPLRIPVALGLAGLIWLLTYHELPDEKEDESTRMARSIAGAFLLPLLALFFGWIYTLFL